MELTDWRGNDILVGSTIIYVVRHSSSVSLVEGYVTEIGEEYTWKVDPVPYVKVMPLMQKGYGRARKRDNKEVKLTRVDLITVID